MPFYKEQNNRVHFLDNAGFAELLPADCIEITDEEAAEITASQTSSVIIPNQVTMRQARLALLKMGLLDEVSAAVSTGSKEMQITWEFSSVVQRDNPLISQLALVLNLTPAQLDDLFKLAASL